jgi:hypothetical protein
VLKPWENGIFMEKSHSFQWFVWFWWTCNIYGSLCFFFSLTFTKNGDLCHLCHWFFRTLDLDYATLQSNISVTIHYSLFPSRFMSQWEWDLILP